MISGHIKAVSEVQGAVEDLRALIETMPDSLDKFRLQAKLEQMEEVTDTYARNSLRLYDNFCNFSMAVGLV
jgi:hypothetical protein